jgi:hypothetical protein
LAIRPFAGLFNDLISNLERSKQLLYTAANIAHFADTQEQFLQLHGERLKTIEEFRKHQEDESRDKVFAVLDWLSPTNQSNRHDEIQEQNQRFPNTTSWLFDNLVWREWMTEGQAKSNILWVTGIPGAGAFLNFQHTSLKAKAETGKTFLFNAMIQRIIETRAAPTQFATAFVYCKYNDPQRSSFEEIMKSLIAQLVQNNQNCIDYLYAFALKSGERHAKTKKTFTQMLCSVVQCYDQVFLGIDGLDECELEERKQTIAALQLLLQTPEQDSKVKIILCSCAEKDIERALRGCHPLDLKSQCLSPAIRSYVRTRLTSLNRSFKFSKSTIEGIVDKIASRSEGTGNSQPFFAMEADLHKGMFLLARLVLDTLEDTGSREEVQEELANDTLPRGINEA